MDFLTFAKACGVLIEYLPPLGQWKRFPTVAHPKKRNASVRWMGSYGHVSNFENGEDASLWRADGDSEAPQIDHAAIKRAQEADARRIREAQEAAARRAAWVMHQTRIDIHPYLKSKGFPEERANVWNDEGVQKLIIPMRVNGRLVGLQQIFQPIDADGVPEVKEDGSPRFVKLFLAGQRSKDAEFVMDNHGPHVLCEGMATAMSARLVLAALKNRYTIHVTFSASNMARVAEGLPGGILLVDHDTKIPTGHTMPTGQRVAQEIGWPAWMSATPGQDFNDAHQEQGLFKMTQALRPLILQASKKSVVHRVPLV